MSSLWPWIAVAGLGALHGLHPATGWLPAAAWGLQARDRGRALQALMPIALGHAVSVTIVAAIVAFGLSVDSATLQLVAGGVLLAIVIAHLRGGARRPVQVPAGHAGLALWSFIAATAHGAGWMLVPALIPLCGGSAALREISASGSLPLILAAVGVHLAAMLVVTGMVAAGACRVLGRLRAFRELRSGSPGETRVAPGLPAAGRSSLGGQRLSDAGPVVVARTQPAAS